MLAPYRSTILLIVIGVSFIATAVLAVLQAAGAAPNSLSGVRSLSVGAWIISSCAWIVERRQTRIEAVLAVGIGIGERRAACERHSR